jgi:N-acetylgalactosamine-6-sulfatase
MKKRSMSLLRSSVAIIIVALLFVSPPQSCFAQQAEERPNFIFIFADDVGFGDLKCYGHPYAVTDNLDRLAREGTSFRQFHTTGNVCPNSRAGFMTSRNPSWYPNYTKDYGFLGTPTVTKILHDAGYTVGHVGKWNIGPGE